MSQHVNVTTHVLEGPRGERVHFKVSRVDADHPVIIEEFGSHGCRTFWRDRTRGLARIEWTDRWLANGYRYTVSHADFEPGWPSQD